EKCRNLALLNQPIVRTQIDVGRPRCDDFELAFGKTGQQRDGLQLFSGNHGLAIGVCGGVCAAGYLKESRRTIRHLVEKRLVAEAPAPGLAGLERAQDRMMSLPKRHARVLVSPIAATAAMPAAQAQSQLYPL